MDEDPFAKEDQGVIKIHHEVILILNFYRLNLKLKI